jgi:hypothetical protein
LKCARVRNIRRLEIHRAADRGAGLVPYEVAVPG